MTTQVTQCPQCLTSFRVTDAQLSIANGSVRCGSCLHIFNAPDFWLDPKIKPVSIPSGQASKPTASTDPEFDNDVFDNQVFADENNEKNTLDSIFEDGDFDDDNYLDQFTDNLLDNDNPANSASDHAAPLQYTPDQSPDTADEQLDTSSDNDHGTKTYDVDNFILEDEPIYDDNLLIGDTRTQSIINTDDDLHKLEPSETDQNGGEFSSYFLELDQQESKPSAVFKELDDIGDEEPDDHELWAKKLLAEAEQEDDKTTSGEPTSQDPATTDQSEHVFEELDENEIQTDQLDPELLDLLNESDEAQDEDLLDSPDTEDHTGDDKRTLLASIEPEPVELATSSDTKPWLKRATMAGVIAALLLLAIQYIAFNFDRIARDAAYRPLLVKTCSIIGCKLPDMHDISLVRSSNLMVRSHPEKVQALVVDAIITNHADFKQAFPVIQLQFKNLAGDIIAGRNFNPYEYLAGELLGQQVMPIKQPIHIALEIVDPGEHAVNYQMLFYPANNR